MKATIESSLRSCETRELVEELKNREGAKEIWANPYKEVDIKVEGPARILVVID